MSYTTLDVSDHDSQPIEVFKFARPGTTYRYAQTDLPVTVNGEVYEPLQITRTALEVASFLESATTVDLVVPMDCDLARDHAFQRSPDDFTVEVRRVERGTNFDTDWQLVWKGKLAGFSTDGRRTSVATVSAVQQALSTGMNAVYYQTVCNHVLFDERCKVNKAAFTATTVILSFSDAAISVLDDGFPDGKLTAGEAVNVRTGERRLIVGNIANVVQIGFPFFDIQNGDDVNLVRGCDHSFLTCAGDFLNLVNYGGFLFVPEVNPFEDGV